MPESKLTVGNVEILSLTDDHIDFPFPLSALYPDLSAEAWEPYRQRYPEVFGGPDTWHTHFGCHLLRSQGRTIMVDTGKGSAATNPGLFSAIGGSDGQLMSELQSAGVSPDDVDTVFFTHLHPDHVGWTIASRASPPKATFSRARHVVHRADWDNFRKPEVQEQMGMKYFDETLAPLGVLSSIDFLIGERALTDEITAIPTPGHTPGHMSLAIVSQGQRAFITGDVANHPAQVTEPTWSSIFDSDGNQAAETRKWFFDRAASENATVVACHFPAPGFGRIVVEQGRRYWQGF